MAPTAIPNEEELDKVVVVGPGPRRRRRHGAPPPPPARGATQTPDLLAARERANVKRAPVSDAREWLAAGDGSRGRGRIGGLTCGRGARGSRSGRCRIWGLRRGGREGGEVGGEAETGNFSWWGKTNPGVVLIRRGRAHGRAGERACVWVWVRVRSLGLHDRALAGSGVWVNDAYLTRGAQPPTGGLKLDTGR